MACSWVRSISDSSFVFGDMLPGAICVFGSETVMPADVLATGADLKKISYNLRTAQALQEPGFTQFAC